MNPTTPAIRLNITKNPVAMLPFGKYIGNIRAGIVRTEAANTFLVISDLTVLKNAVSIKHKNKEMHLFRGFFPLHDLHPMLQE